MVDTSYPLDNDSAATEEYARLVSELLVPTALVAIVVAVTALAKRIGVLAPILLVAAGIGLSYVPGVPTIVLNPELVLAGVLPPLLYVAALQTSVPAFRFNLRPILLLAVGLVLFTTTVVGFTLHAVVPQIPLAAAFALGAIVAPPDAVAATAIARRIGLPRRIVTILEGESLVNDATALAVLRIAVAAALGQAVSAVDIAGGFALAAIGGVVVGLGVAWVFAWLHCKTTDPLFDNTLSLLTPFATYAAAEAINASGVVAVVIAGLYLGNRWPILMSAASRLQMDAFWKMVRFLLESAVFLLVGLQLREIVRGLRVDFATVAWATLAVVGVVILARFAWLYPATYLARLVPRVRDRDPSPPLSIPTVIGWAGMRGVVTLAAAFSLPLQLGADVPFPGRDLLVWLAFAVIAVTLLVQGLTLRGVVRALKVPRDNPTQDLLAEAAVQSQASQAALARLDAEADGAPPDVVQRLREHAEKRTNHAWERLGSQERETPAHAYRRLRRSMLEAERDVFREARDAGRIPEEVMAQAQRDLDLEESILTRE
jgi:CPA1 family monovalent cation:H+ antiporter